MTPYGPDDVFRVKPNATRSAFHVEHLAATKWEHGKVKAHKPCCKVTVAVTDGGPQLEAEVAALGRANVEIDRRHP